MANLADALDEIDSEPLPTSSSDSALGRLKQSASLLRLSTAQSDEQLIEPLHALLRNNGYRISTEEIKSRVDGMNDTNILHWCMEQLNSIDGNTSQIKSQLADKVSGILELSEFKDDSSNINKRKRS